MRYVSSGRPARSAHPRKLGPQPARMLSGAREPSSDMTQTFRSSSSIHPPGAKFLPVKSAGSYQKVAGGESRKASYS